MIRKFRKEEHGQALVEMALVLPLFFLLLFGVIEMGRIGHAYIMISNAAREGGRLATIGKSDPVIEDSIKNAATTLNPDNLTITISPIQALRQSGEGVTVYVEYPVQLIVPLINNIIPNPFVVSTSINMRLE
ncbi:hypothetical protein UF75_3736 [Desulfosporosinus sp. I2]|uniref:TadE/TadG family type IV pilus assembly protein n=1 Tax=Desulfosporosinus sp. I2 TaxID=1617025 RepID=UPI0005EF0DFE|nr:TadE/TadG family type IV pilus assembly protein [Desulfosporosinus sp. I2]KJR45865.1 hypothetical protein UF75_3736 [Desulfosporosinus sp. I2]